MRCSRLGVCLEVCDIDSEGDSTCFAAETVSTLKFAHRAKSVRNTAHVNEDADQRTLLRKYEQELRKLRAELQMRQREVVDKRHLLAVKHPPPYEICTCPPCLAAHTASHRWVDEHFSASVVSPLQHAPFHRQICLNCQSAGVELAHTKGLTAYTQHMDGRKQ